MAEVETTGDNFIRLEEKNASMIPSIAGTYLLADNSRQVIYIGMSMNLNKSILDVLECFSSCLKKAEFFKVSINPDPGKGAINLFIQHKEENGGAFPRCNKIDISAGR
ncbi:hypothetical protein KKI23_03870 [Patescibacteria group bacterium]|nr:hypothetical protein [Patescibacteria group bacterium]